MKDLNYCIAFDEGERTRQYVECAKQKNIVIKTVNCMSDDIIEQLEDVDALVWHWTHANYAEKRNAKNILKAVQEKGIPIYPNLNTCSFFDDKIAQKYLLEALNAPLAPTHVFFDKKQAEKWIIRAKYPIVHKLAGGAGSTNVSLICNVKEARKICKKRFASHKNLKEIFGNNTGLKKKIRYYIKGDNERYMGLDKGYVLFQEFLPNNLYDIRVTIIGKKAVIFRRYVREHDFRASGSGKIDYKVSEEDKGAIIIAFQVSEILKSQTMAFDFAYAEDGQLKIIEMSYGFVSKAVQDAGGYYDNEMRWHEEPVIVESEVIEMLINEIAGRKNDGL